MNWQQFFTGYRLIPISGDHDLLFQVGATVAGRPISPEQFEQTIADVQSRLGLDTADELLDLCCGNGVITQRLAGLVRSVVGVDFSQPYIDNARRYKSAVNIEYICGDACDLGNSLAGREKKFNKVLMHSALAYLDLTKFQQLLANLEPILAKGGLIFIAAVPDAARRWRFYNTWRRSAVYIWNSIRGKNSGIGKWWRRKELMRACREQGFRCQFFEPHPILHVAHYRFDVLIARQSN